MYKRAMEVRLPILCFSLYGRVAELRSLSACCWPAGQPCEQQLPLPAHHFPYCSSVVPWQVQYQLKMKASRELLSEVQKKYPTMLFRWVRNHVLQVAMHSIANSAAWAPAVPEHVRLCALQ